MKHYEAFFRKIIVAVCNNMEILIALILSANIAVMVYFWISNGFVTDINGMMGRAIGEISIIFAVSIIILYVRKAINNLKEWEIQPCLQVKEIGKEEYLIRVDDSNCNKGKEGTLLYNYYTFNKFEGKEKIIVYNKNCNFWCEIRKDNYQDYGIGIIKEEEIQKLKVFCFSINNIGLGTAKNINLSFKKCFAIDENDDLTNSNILKWIKNYRNLIQDLGNIQYADYEIPVGEEIVIVLILNNFDQTHFEMKVSCKSQREKNYIRKYNFRLLCHIDTNNLIFNHDKYNEAFKHTITRC
jgi:hypothetical protein